MTQAENVIMMFLVFSILTISFGGTIALGDVQSTIIVVIRPFQTPGDVYNQLVGSQPSCGPVDFGCQAAKGVAQATSAIAASIGYPGYVGYDITGRLVAFGQLMNTLIGSPIGAAGAVPFAILFILGLGLFIFFETLRILRGSSSGI